MANGSRRAAGENLAAMGRRMFHCGLELLFPPICAACEADMTAGSETPGLCEECLRSFLANRHAGCPRCGLGNRPGGAIEGAECAACRERPMRFDRLVALADYQGALREAVLRMKRPGGEALAAALAGLMWRLRGKELRELGIDVIVPIPMHWLRRMARGANCPELIAERLRRELRVPVSHLLRRRRYTRSQGHLSATRRAANVQGAFRLAHPEDFAGARALLVDDVVTSGATTNEAARLLKRGGAAFVAVATICRTQAPV